MKEFFLIAGGVALGCAISDLVASKSSEIDNSKYKEGKRTMGFRNVGLSVFLIGVGLIVLKKGE